jgi:hypothetical protein
MNDDIQMTFLALGIVAFGIAAIYLARWAKLKNQQVKTHRDGAEGNGALVGEHRVPDLVSVFLFGDLSKLQSRFGRWLAIATIIFVSVVLIFIGVLIISRIFDGPL